MISIHEILYLNKHGNNKKIKNQINLTLIQNKSLRQVKKAQGE